MSEEGQRLRARLCVPSADHLLEGGTAPRDAYRRKLAVAHFVGLLPRRMVRRIAGGGCARETGSMSYSQVVHLANFSLSRPKVCGRKGEAITGHKRVLAALADFVAYRSASNAASVASRITVPVAAMFVESEWRRGVVEGSRSLGVAAHKSLVWLTEHAGLACDKASLYKDVVRAFAVPARLSSDAPPEKQQAGPLPLRLVAGLEALLLQHPEPSATYSAGLLTYVRACVIGAHGGLRAIELESAQLTDARGDPSFIDATFAPKGDPSLPRAQLRLRPIGVMGPFTWWPSYRAAMLGAPTLLPQLSGGRTLLTSTGVIMLAHPATDRGRQLLVECYTIPVWGVSAEVVRSLRLTAHSMHDTLPHTFMGWAAEPVLCMGDPISGALACGNWAGAPPSVAATRGDAHGGARSAEQRAAIPALYAGAVGEGTNRSGALDASLAARWSVVSLAWAASVAPGAVAFMEIDPGEGWTVARGWGLAYARLGGVLPLPPPEDSFWYGGCLQHHAWVQAHALLRDWRQRAGAQARREADASSAAVAALCAPPDLAAAPWG